MLLSNEKYFGTFNWKEVEMKNCRRFELSFHLGALLRGCREAKGLTQEDLAEKVGVTREAISMVEGGKRCRLETVWGLSQALDVRLSDLIRKTESLAGME